MKRWRKASWFVRFEVWFVCVVRLWFFRNLKKCVLFPFMCTIVSSNRCSLGARWLTSCMCSVFRFRWGLLKVCCGVTPEYDFVEFSLKTGSYFRIWNYCEQNNLWVAGSRRGAEKLNKYCTVIQERTTYTPRISQAPTTKQSVSIHQARWRSAQYCVSRVLMHVLYDTPAHLAGADNQTIRE